jgi:hypothetical protein
METKNNISQKHIASFTAFILPFVAGFILKDEGFSFTESDKKFISSYIKAGIYFWALLIFTILLSFLKYFLGYKVIFLDTILGITIWVLAIFLLVYLFVAIFFIFSDKTFDFADIRLSAEKVDVDFDLLYFYIPGYNFWLWYKYRAKVYSIRFLKESVLLWFLFALFFVLSYSIAVLIFFLIIVRVILLLFEIDILSFSYYRRLVDFWQVNPEEVFAPAIGYIKYFIFKFFKSYKSLPSIVNETQKEYAQLIDFEAFKTASLPTKLQLIFQYLALVALI